MPVPDSVAVTNRFADIPLPEGTLQHIEDPSNFDEPWWVCNETSTYISKGHQNEPIIMVFTTIEELDLPISSAYEIFQNWEVQISGESQQMDGLLVRISDWDGGIPRAHSLLRDIEEIYSSNPDSTSIEVVECIINFLNTKLQRGDLLNDGEIKGLYGELSLMERMLDIATSHSPPIEPATILDSWNGYVSPSPTTPLGARRDYKRTGRPYVIEVKATGNDLREHQISNWQQLIPGNEEELYFYSVSVKLDASGDDSLPEIINRILEGLSGAQNQQRLMNYLQQYGTGYNPMHNAHYNRLRLLVDTFTPEMFQVSELDIFVEDPHAHSHSYSYTLDIQGETPMAHTNVEQVIIGMLG